MHVNLNACSPISENMVINNYVAHVISFPENLNINEIFPKEMGVVSPIHLPLFMLHLGPEPQGTLLFVTIKAIQSPFKRSKFAGTFLLWQCCLLWSVSLRMTANHEKSIHCCLYPMFPRRWVIHSSPGSKFYVAQKANSLSLEIPRQE